MRLPILAFGALSLAIAFPVLADVYRWTDDKGVVHYTDKPPAKDAKPAELPQLQTYKPSASAPAGVGAAAAAEPAKTVTPTIQITAPQAEETVRDNDGKVSVGVATELQAGQGVIYYLDGHALNPATPSTGYLITGVVRGEHQVSATVVDPDGQELVRSTPVTFYMMPSEIFRHR